LQYLIDFLETKDIEKTKIFDQLKCTAEEAEILRHITSKHIKGSEENSVFLILDELFTIEGYGYIEKLSLIKNLLDLGWIVQSTFAQVKTGEVSNLELINATVMLSKSFEKLLEEGTLEVELPQSTPYTDHLEYLRDQFHRIEIYQKISTIRHNYKKKSLSIDRLERSLAKLENRIRDRIRVTKMELAAETLFKEFSLSEKEQIIFLALLKEEYSGELDSLREMNNLINLISENDYDKIKNRSLLEENSTLIDEDIIDYDEMLTAFGGVTRSFYISEEYLHKIIHPHKAKKKKKKRIRLDMLVKEQDIFELVTPKTDIDDVILHPKTREILDNILKTMDKKKNRGTSAKGRSTRKES